MTRHPDDGWDVFDDRHLTYVVDVVLVVVAFAAAYGVVRAAVWAIGKWA